MAAALCALVCFSFGQTSSFETPLSISSTGSNPHPSSMFDIQSSSKGILIPRMTFAARNNIQNAATGLLIYQTNNAPGFYYYNGSGWQTIGTVDENWTSSGSNLYTNTANVGIGTTNPSAKLVVGGNTKLNGALTINNGSQGDGKVLTSDANGVATWQNVGTSTWSTAGINTYRSYGNVGIGTTSPTAALHIKQENNTVADGLRLETSLSTQEDWYMFMDGNDDLVIRNDAQTLFIMKKNSGYVALGDIFATGYRLSVDGKIAAEDLLIEYADYWPDYVFEDDYNLLTIDEFSQSIKDNKHLPGIPSAKEVEEDGFLVGDMQKRTMEKLEELSLYIIELHERIKELESQLD